MNKSIITREGWHTTNHGFRYYVEGGRILYGMSSFYNGNDVTLYPHKVCYKGGRIIGYERVEPLARYYNITRHVWRTIRGEE